MVLARMGHVNGERRANKRAGRLKSALILRVGPEHLRPAVAKNETPLQAPLPFLMNRLTAWLGVTVVAVLVFWLLAPVLAPFVIAAIMAYVLHPLVLRLEGLATGRVPRLLAVVLV